MLRAVVEHPEAPDIRGDAGGLYVIAEDSHAVALGELAALVVEVFSGAHVVEHGPVLPACQLGGREDDCVERDVVLSYELEELRVLPVMPPVLPLIRAGAG